MIPSLACPPWRADLPGPSGEQGDQRRQLHHAPGHDQALAKAIRAERREIEALLRTCLAPWEEIDREREASEHAWRAQYKPLDKVRRASAFIRGLHRRPAHRQNSPLLFREFGFRSACQSRDAS